MSSWWAEVRDYAHVGHAWVQRWLKCYSQSCHVSRMSRETRTFLMRLTPSRRMVKISCIFPLINSNIFNAASAAYLAVLL